MDEDIKIFIPDEKFLTVGKKKFNIARICSRRSLKASIMFNKLNEKGSEERKQIETDYDFYVSMLDVAFMLIRIDFKIVNILDWAKRQLLSKRYILNNLDIKELATFIDDALEPIIGTKKKELEKQETAADIMVAIVEKIGIDQFTQLLVNLSVDVDTQKVM